MAYVEVMVGEGQVPVGGQVVDPAVHAEGHVVHVALPGWEA